MTSRRRGDTNPKLHMDRQPTAARITDPSLPAGKRREIDNVMKKARANNTNEYWDKKLIEAEEKDPNRWRHTGYKKMYFQGESSSADSDREGVERDGTGVPAAYRYASTAGPGNGPSTSHRYGRSRSRSPSRLRKSPPLSPAVRRHTSPGTRCIERRMSPPSGLERSRPRSPPTRGGTGLPRSPNDLGRVRALGGGRPRSPPEPSTSSSLRRKTSRSPLSRRRSPISTDKRSGSHILPRSKRPPSPPPRHSLRSHSNSSASSSTDDSCSLCSQTGHYRSRSASLRRARPSGAGPRSPPPKNHSRYRGVVSASLTSDANARGHGRLNSPSQSTRGSIAVDKYRDDKICRIAHERNMAVQQSESHGKVSHHSPLEDPRLKNRPPEPPEPTSSSTVLPQKKKKKEKELRARIKIEGEKRKKHNSSSDSDDSGATDSDDTSLPTFSATTRLTLSERFGKMAQWSIDRSNMENMRITKDSTGGALKVMIEEGLESPPRRYEYSPAPAGHFPEELATTAPSGMLSWDDVRVRYEYYKSRGYLRDLDLKDYVKWEEWWYKYQEWLKQERYYEYWDRQQIRRRRKKMPLAQRLN